MIQPDIKSPKKNDIIVFDGTKWVNYQKSQFLKDLQNEVKILRIELENAKMALKQAQNQIMELASIMKGE